MNRWRNALRQPAGSAVGAKVMFPRAMKSLPTLLLLLIPTIALTAAEPEVAVDAENFSLVLDGGRTIRRTELRELPATDAMIERFVLADPSLTIVRTRGKAGAGYQRTLLEITNTGAEELPLARVVVADFPAPAGARVAGECAGSPVVAGAEFFGVEHPLAENVVAGGRVRCSLPIMQPLRPGEKVVVSFVCGRASEPSQIRRAFAAYLEHARPRPSAPFLLHNTWYNLGYSNEYSERDELDLIDALGRELEQKRGAKIDAFVLDDGWDDTHTLWRFHAGWPDGLKAMTAASSRWGAVPGIWMSPWGGYNRPKQERLAAAAPEGFEIRDGGFSLAGPRYYARFRELCVEAVRQGVGFFKFDGIGTKSEGAIDPAAGRDFDAMLRLVAELRALRPDLYVSQTVGTWPSPWWLLHVDNIWRGGEDHSFAGVGSDRQQWITYRDAQVYRNVVRRAPLFPLNALMLHGIILAMHAERLATADPSDFASEVRSFFGSGVQLQELYLSPELLSKKNWDDLAAAAKWARAHADVLKDAHWIGGDPEKLEPYGWACWSPRGGIVTLRNPSDHEASFTLDAGAAFELPSNEAKHFRLSGACGDTETPVATLDADRRVEIRLRPFQVLMLEATPLAE